MWRVSGLFFAGLVSWEMTNLMPGHVTSGSYRNKFTSCEHPVNCYKFQNTSLGLLIFLAGLHRADLGTVVVSVVSVVFIAIACIVILQ